MNEMTEKKVFSSSKKPGVLWDLPTRLFHWSLVGLVAFLIYSGKVGLDDYDWHMYAGYGVLGLVIFRVFWGFVGGRRSRFYDFIRHPEVVFLYLRTGKNPTPGHSPIGGYAILMMLALLAGTAATGLFSNDDVFTEGPLANLVTKDTSDYLTYIHYLLGWGLIGMIAMHLGAIAFYAVKGDNLVTAMITGSPKRGIHEPNCPPRTRGSPAAFIVSAGLAAAIVYAIVSL